MVEDAVELFVQHRECAGLGLALVSYLHEALMKMKD